MLPLQGVGILIVLGFCVYMGLLEKKRGAGLNPTGKAAELTEDMSMAGNDAPADPSLKRPKLVWINWLVTLVSSCSCASPRFRCTAPS